MTPTFLQRRLSFRSNLNVLVSEANRHKVLFRSSRLQSAGSTAAVISGRERPYLNFSRISQETVRSDVQTQVW